MKKSIRNNQASNYIHCSDVVNFHTRPFLLWTMRQGYQRQQISQEMKDFFAEKRYWHNELQESCRDNEMSKEENLKASVNIKNVLVDIMGNLDLYKEGNPAIHFIEVKSYFHIPNYELPFYRDLIQVLIYCTILALKHEDTKIFCHVVYLNKGFCFEFNREWMLPFIDLFLDTKRQIEDSYCPIVAPIKGQCTNCYGDKALCKNKTKIYRDKWSKLGS